MIAGAAVIGIIAARRRGVPTPLRRLVDDVVTVVATTAPAESPDAGGTDEKAPKVVSDRERVLQLLQANDGRLHQQQIVEATDWSKAKVSELLSEMEADGEITKLRIGRENLITLPDARTDLSTD